MFFFWTTVTSANIEDEPSQPRSRRPRGAHGAVVVSEGFPYPKMLKRHGGGLRAPLLCHTAILNFWGVGHSP